ncbi:hypothetical protein PVAG01_02506 [Phlyctema vagabunda]|uniref:Uncharacterized protein n=1 Tax=Phlyctema vagabunda TaxID=108571 RepID=A0ABR4PQW2_9HELO
MFRTIMPQRSLASLGRVAEAGIPGSRMVRNVRIPSKPIDARRNIFSMSRLPMRMEQQRQDGRVQNVQKVKFRKPGMRVRGMIVSFVVIYVCYSLYSRVVFDPLEVAATEALKGMPDDSEDHEDERPPFFIPFPGTTRVVKPVPYRGSDPEWQEFVKFSKDQALSKKIRDELAQYVRQLASRHPVLKMRCGSDIKLKRYWLDIDFPPIPPPEYERSGIEITDDYIAWSTMPVDSLLVHKIRQAFWPTALVKSTWSFTKTLFIEDTKRFARFLGFQSQPPPISIDQVIAKQQQMITKQFPTKDGPAKKPEGLSDAPNNITNPPQLDKSNISGKGTAEPNSQILPTAMIYEHFFRAIMAFKLTLQQTWKPAPSFPPRGSILVGGLVELDSSKAWLVFDVKAAWDPKTRQYDTRSLNIRLRRMQPKKQAPLDRR